MMHSPASETAEDSHISRKDLSDAKISSHPRISEDMEDTSEDTQCSSKTKHRGEKENVDKNLQLPVSAGLTSQEYLDKMSILQQLWDEEKELKIAIAYEKLRIEQPVFLDADVLHKKIAEYQRLVQEARNGHKMKNVMCRNLQLANTLQRIVGKTKATKKETDFSDTQRKHIKDFLKEKKDLNKRIGVKRKEIAEMDEDILEREQTLINTTQKRSKQEAGCSLNCANTETKNLEDLERLEENSKKVTERVHLLSCIIQSLIPHTGSRWQEEPELSDLMAECEKVSKCQLDGLDDINALLTSVCSVNL